MIKMEKKTCELVDKAVYLLYDAIEDMKEDVNNRDLARAANSVLRVLWRTNCQS